MRDNRTKQEIRETKKLNARKAKGKIVINTSDKSQLTSISSRENYEAQCQQQIGPNDRQLTWKEFNGVKDTVYKHNTAVANLFRVGEN